MVWKKLKNFTFVAIEASDFQTEVAGAYVFQFIKYLTYNSDKKY